MGSRQRLRIDILGPLRVRDPEGVDLTPPGSLQRRLLALLVLRRGHVVPVDTAIDVLWPVTPPRDAVAALHNHVFRLRRGLPVDVIDSAGSGYRLDATLVDLDADRLTVSLDLAERCDAGAVAVIDELLERWHGPAYAELDDVDDGRSESVRLDDLRVRAREARAGCRLAIGDMDGLVGELVALADAEPLRERPRSLLMAALAGTGRAVEALRVYDDFRRLLADEIGIEPSPALRAQHAELLAAPNETATTAASNSATTAASTLAWTPATRLAVPTTSLIGRHALVEDLTAIVEHHRLVTLVGPGGVGKTRLAVEVGHRLRAARPDRPVALCELAVAKADAPVDIVAAVLAIDARPGVALADRLASMLGASEIVLVLDNCEHVLDEVAELVGRLLSSCPNVSVLATSRERLRVPGEQVRPVPTLRAGTDDAAAIQLFVERARAVAPDFEPDRGELEVIGEVVGRLDGLPLAIELAAARLHTHDVAEVAAGLDDRFALLGSGYRTSARHGSLSAAVSWSTGLLDERLRQTFTDLSVFAGSFTAADAAAVSDVEVSVATQALAQLAERSLVMRAPQRRYVLLETLRAFGAEQLVADGRDRRVRDRHARHQVDWVEQANERLGEPGRAVLAEIDDRLPELRTALDWLLDHDEIELAGRLVTALAYYGFFRLRPDVLAWSERVTAAAPDNRGPSAAGVWVAAAYAAWMAGDAAESAARSARALRAAEEGGGGVSPKVATVRGNVELFEGRLDAAARWYRRGVEAAGDDRVQRLFVAATELLALAYAGEPTAGERAAELLAEVGREPTAVAAYAWYCAGEVDLAVDVERARSRFALALELAGTTNASFVTGVAGASKASIDARIGDPVAAAQDYRRLDLPLAPGRDVVDAVDDAALDRRAAGPPRPTPRCGRAGGAVRATAVGHRIFGADEVALARARRPAAGPLGDDAYGAAPGGRALDGDGDATLRPRPPAPAAAAAGRDGTGDGRGRHQRGCSARMPSTDLATISWVRASLPGWNPPQRTSR